MRAPSSSFKNELAAYRRRLIKERSDYLRLAHALQVLDRWRDHAAVETVWNTIKAKLPAEAATAEQFINLVLQRWDTATELNELVPKIPERSAEVCARIEGHRKNKRYDLAAAEMARLDDFHDNADAFLGRKKRDAARKKFKLGWGEKFKELCGQPLDEVVRVLTEIAFDSDQSIQDVRDARRPTTERNRQSAKK